MLEGFPESMVLLDCETTGSKASRDRITEIAMIAIEQGHVVERWQSLINPGMPIPSWITRLTGISNEMVSQAPAFEEVVESLLARLKDRVMVAHNARFDYSFIKAGFKRAGVDFSCKTLCSVKLSRKLYPGFRRHRLDDIIKRLGICVSHRHRAMIDAEVILSFFERIASDFEPDEINAICQLMLRRPAIPSHLDDEDINRIPNGPGVYRFYAENGSLLYIGKSVSLRDRVLSHFNQDINNHRELKINQQIHHIDFDKTPSDFGAQLAENHQIKSLSPTFNLKQRRQRALYQFEIKKNANGFITLELVTADINKPPAIYQRFGLFRSRKQAMDKLVKIAERHRLCHRLTGIEKREGACFAYQLGKCDGACLEKEKPDEHNLRLEFALLELKNRIWPWPGPLLVEEKPADSDRDNTHYHLIDQWLYLGRVCDPSEIPPLLTKRAREAVPFDLDSYKILIKFLLNPALQQLNRLTIKPIPAELQQAEMS